MGAITPQFMMDLESSMRVEVENEYNRLADSRNLWWQLITRTRETQSRRDIVMWLLNTAQIYDEGEGGNIRFDDLVSTYTEIEHRYAGVGLRLTRSQLMDTDGGGVDLAAQWSADVGAYMGYWPQKKAAEFLKRGHTADFTTYDGKPFFATDHKANPFRGGETFANVLTGAASGAYPGALPLDTGTVEEAFANLQKLFAYIASLKMPNGVDPRFLRPAALLVPPKLTLRANLITGAKYIAMGAGGGANVAPTDVEGLISSMGYARVVQADELAGFEDDRTYFVVCEQLSTSKLGALIYTKREDFHIDYYGAQTEADLNRRDEFEWHCKGRNGISAGHPYLLFKVKAV